MQITVEGKVISIKLGASKKESQLAAIAQLKKIDQEMKSLFREAKHEFSKKVKKVEKVIGKEDCKVFEREANEKMGKLEKAGEEVISAKEKDLLK